MRSKQWPRSSIEFFANGKSLRHSERFPTREIAAHAERFVHAESIEVTDRGIVRSGVSGKIVAATVARPRNSNGEAENEQHQVDGER